jgi:hypothetical protein
MMLDYTEENLNRVIESIRCNLTIDLLPKKMQERNISGGSNGTYGHCHTAAGVIYKIFGHKNVHMYRALDDENLYHWWIVDKNGKIIDPTSEQYTLLGRVAPYDKGEKAGLLGFDYKKRVLTLLDRVKNDLNLSL